MQSSQKEESLVTFSTFLTKAHWLTYHLQTDFHIHHFPSSAVNAK